MLNCSMCGQQFKNDILFLNHMMEKHGFRNSNVDKPNRNSREDNNSVSQTNFCFSFCS